MTDNARLAELLDRYFDEAATAAETRELGDLLRADQAARRSFWQAAELQSQLRAAVQLAHAKAASGEEEAPASQSAPATRAVYPALWDSLPSAIDWRTNAGRFMVLVLAITLAAWGGIYLLVRRAAVERQVADVAEPAPEQEPESRIAFLRQYDGALWSDGAESIPSQGRGYFAGTTLDLQEGLARFQFQDGAEIVIEGPCQITFEGRNAARLHRGRLAALVEGEAARGFVIDTPFATVTDLGTEFGVAVCDEAAEVEVYQGEVRMEVADSSGRKRAVRITAGGTAKADLAGRLTTGTGGAERLDIVRDMSRTAEREQAAEDGRAEIIYEQTFATGGTNRALSYFGWTGYRSNGDDLSESTGGQMFVISEGFVFIGSMHEGDQYVALADAVPTIDPARYENDLTIAFDQNATDEGPSSVGQMGWRVLARVDGTWYASDFLGFSSSIQPRSARPSDPVWHAWETDLTNGFDIHGIRATATVLPAGDVTGAGVLAVDGLHNNDRMRIHRFRITGTAIPESSPTSP